MKKVAILLPLFAFIAYFTLSSNAGGSSTNMTGSGGDTTGCGGSGCHGRKNDGVTTAVWLEDSAGNPVYAYVPGRRYIIRFNALHSISSVTLPKFGFQMLTLDRFGAQAGKYFAPTIPTGTMLDSSSASGKVIFEQKVALAASSGYGEIGTLYKTSVAWTAPAAGTDTVKIYTITCLVNAAGDTSGDKWNRSVYRIPEGSATAVHEVKVNHIINAGPNPINNELHIYTDADMQGDYSIQVFDLNGLSIAREDVSGENLNTTVINSSAWAAGMYYLIIKGNDSQRIIPIVKQ